MTDYKNKSEARIWTLYRHGKQGGPTIGFNEMVKVIEYSAYQSILEQAERLENALFAFIAAENGRDSLAKAAKEVLIDWQEFKNE